MQSGTGTENEHMKPINDKMIEIRRHLHRHPEVANEEVETTRYIRERLTEAGVRIADYPLRTGLIAEIGGHREGPVIALRADIDALPIEEQTGLPYASTIPGKMHACGHDFHTAAMIGAAVLLKEREAELPGTVRLLFQPAEETATGAKQVIASGALEGVQAVFGMHNKPDLPVGTIGIKGGPLMAAADGFVIEVDGVGTHAAVPDAGVDPIVAAAHIVTALQSVVSRNVSPLRSAVVSVTQIHSGTVWNVIPQRAVMEGTLRTFDLATRELVMERFAHIAETVAAAFGATATVRWVEGPPPIDNNDALAELATGVAAELGYNPITPQLSSAGEDFAVYQQKVPGLFVFMGTAGTREWHHPDFTLDESALPVSAEFFARLAERALQQLTN
ncbi:M20 peptidase aminoacylase family protein [Paenibacillus sp. M1]|uniref:M20 peptidase aminoacylase family protein n=1 Tax=Paenibacillus haidiansis TaxID=1574488 RepID=A0ABU7VMI4_9BACL